MTLGSPWDRGAASTAFLLPPFSHSHPSASPPRTSGSHSSKKISALGPRFPLLFAPALPTGRIKRRRIPQEAGKGIGESALPGNWDPPRGGRGVCACPKREPVCGCRVEGVSGVGHWMRALIHCALTLCQTVLALYTLSHLTFKRKPQDAISMPI